MTIHQLRRLRAKPENLALLNREASGHDSFAMVHECLAGLGCHLMLR